MKMPADVVEQAKQILGGKNLTAKRLKEMLADYAKLKSEGVIRVENRPAVNPVIESMDDARAMIHDRMQQADAEHDERVQVALAELDDDPAPSPGPCPSVLHSPGGPGRPDLVCGLPAGHKGEHGYIERKSDVELHREFPVTVPPELAQQATQITASTGMDPVMAALLGAIQELRQEVASLRQPTTPQDKAEALMNGKLPPRVIAGPVGYTGSAALPQNVWFESPYGPKIQMKICGCENCPPHRKTHYYCPMCKSGPHNYTDYVGGAKTHLAPGATWGIQHVMCSPQCWNMYLPLVDGRRRVRDGVPRKVDKPMPEFEGATAGADVKLPEARPYGSD